MTRPLSPIFWIELTLSALAAIATVASLISPQWIEALFEASPDHGDGSSEWGLTLGLLIATAILAALTRREWRRARRRTA